MVLSRPVLTLVVTPAPGLTLLARCVACSYVYELRTLIKLFCHQRKHQSRPSMDGSVQRHGALSLSLRFTAHNDSPPLGIPRTSSRASGHMLGPVVPEIGVFLSRSNLRDLICATAGPDGKPSAPWLTDISNGSSRFARADLGMKEILG
jgi:hypothetical protein